MTTLSLLSTALSSAVFVEAADANAAAAVRHIPTNFTTVPTSFCPANDTSKSTKGGSKGEKFAEQTSGGNSAGGGDDGGDDVAATFVQNQLTKIEDAFDAIEGHGSQVRESREQVKLWTIDALVEAYKLTERARADIEVFAELERVFPDHVGQPARDNPAILVVNGKFKNVRKAQRSVYASILQIANGSIDGTRIPMTPKAFEVELSKGIRKFYNDHHKPTEQAAKKAATSLNVTTQPTDDLFSLTAPFRTTAFGVDRGVFRVEITVENFMGTARLLNIPAVEPEWAKFEETTGGEKKQPEVGPVTAPTALPIATDIGSDHDTTVQQALFEIVSATGITSLNGAVKALNEAGIKTARGKDWYATSLKNALERWNYSGMEDFIARYTGEAVGPNGDDDQPPPASSAPVPTVPNTITEAKGNDVKASPATVLPAGYTDAAEIVLNACDGEPENTPPWWRRSEPDPYLTSLKLEVEEVEWDVTLTLPEDQVGRLVETILDAHKNRYAGSKRFDGSTRRKQFKTYLDLFVKPGGAEVRIGVLGEEPRLVANLTGWTPNDADYRTSRRVIECDAVELAETLATLIEDSDRLDYTASGVRAVRRAMDKPAPVRIRGRFEGLELLVGEHQLGYISNERPIVEHNRIGHPAPRITVRKADTTNFGDDDDG